MSNTQIIVAVIAVAVVGFTGFGLIRAVSAHGSYNVSNQAFGKAGLHKAHWFANHDWTDSENLMKYKSECMEKGADKLNHFVQHVYERLELSSEQLGKWQNLSNAIQTEAVTIDQICDKIFTLENHADTPARMELITVVMAMGTESLQRIQPHVNTLYQILDVEQQRELDELLSHRRHRHWF